MYFFFFSSRRRHTRSLRDWSSDVCSSDLGDAARAGAPLLHPGVAAATAAGAAAHRARPETRPDERAGARAALRPDRVPQRRDLFRPADAGAPLLALRRGARAGWHPAAGQGRDAVRPGARASRAGRAARADLSQSGRVTRKPKEAPAPKERIVKVAA